KPIGPLASRRSENSLASRHVLPIPPTQEPKGPASDAPHLSLTAGAINLTWRHQMARSLALSLEGSQAFRTRTDCREDNYRDAARLVGIP
ncbi:MAG TPA: hypothetical protein VEU07_08330, partial [Candidatus Acidoferrum sp.]|nr:hypothetical protein [Candidatus Acidoferrum sp.]